MENKRIIDEKSHIKGINEMKFLLILGVVLIHCDISYAYTTEEYDTNIGIRLCHYMSDIVCRVCVPCFFIISGYLYFNNIRNFNFEIYKRKTISRFHTLFVPYIVWCSICCLLLYVKHRFFHMSGLNIFLDNGEINWWNLLKGYIYISEAEGRPYAFAFWFVRNLMVFMLVSPIAWLIVKRKMLMGLLLVAFVLFNIGFYGFEWFLSGAFLAQDRVKYPNLTKSNVMLYSVLFWMMCLIRVISSLNLNIIFFIQIISGLCLTHYLSLSITRRERISGICKTAVASTFMIYATHQCYCSKVREFYCGLLGSATFVSPIISYILSFMTLTLLGIIAYVSIKKVSPNFIRIITGGR